MKPKASTSRRLQENQNPEEPPLELRSKFGVTTQVRGRAEGFPGPGSGNYGGFSRSKLREFSPLELSRRESRGTLETI